MICGTSYTVISDERENYSITQASVPVGEDCENQPDGNYCNSVHCVDYDYSDCATVDYVSTVIPAGVCK